FESRVTRPSRIQALICSNGIGPYCAPSLPMIWYVLSIAGMLIRSFPAQSQPISGADFVRRNSTRREPRNFGVFLPACSLLQKRTEQINRHWQKRRRVVLAGNLAHGLQET